MWIFRMDFDAGILKASPMELDVDFGADPHQICIQSVSKYGSGFSVDFKLLLDFNGKIQRRIHVKN